MFWSHLSDLSIRLDNDNEVFHCVWLALPFRGVSLTVYIKPWGAFGTSDTSGYSQVLLQSCAETGFKNWHLYSKKMKKEFFSSGKAKLLFMTLLTGKQKFENKRLNILPKEWVPISPSTKIAVFIMHSGKIYPLLCFLKTSHFYSACTWNSGNSTVKDD